jgi:DHA1 family bicyclomycin/chloramphenicol resistance-like MFS transporter
MANMPPAAPARATMGPREFIAFVAAVMAVNAFSIDLMLPALPAIAHAIAIEGDNQRQWIVTAYMLGVGSMQMVYGPLSDRFGRRPVLLAGLATYVVFSLLVALATNFTGLIAARVLQGCGASAASVLPTSLVRDRFSGSEMARVMSLTFIFFLAVPILGPSIGQFIILFGPWPWTFVALALFGFVVMLWTMARLPESRPARRERLDALAQVGQALRLILGNRISIGYMLAMTFLIGGLFSFVTSAQQIVADAFGAGRWFSAVFAGIAGIMGVSGYLNSRIVKRFGSRLLSHRALGGFIVCAGLHTAVSLCGYETIWSFCLMQAATMFFFSLAVSNFGAIAMEPLSTVAGTAASVQAMMMTVGGGLLGVAVGQQFDGTSRPLTVGFVIYGLAAAIAIKAGEHRR